MGVEVDAGGKGKHFNGTVKHTNCVCPLNSHADAACSYEAAPVRRNAVARLRIPAIGPKVPRRHRNAQPSRPLDGVKKGKWIVVGRCSFHARS